MNGSSSRQLWNFVCDCNSVTKWFFFRFFKIRNYVYHRRRGGILSCVVSNNDLSVEWKMTAALFGVQCAKWLLLSAGCPMFVCAYGWQNSVSAKFLLYRDRFCVPPHDNNKGTKKRINICECVCVCVWPGVATIFHDLVSPNKNVIQSKIIAKSEWVSVSGRHQRIFFYSLLLLLWL